ncbi:helix-turn-helix domain-containing protein [Nocardia sp. CDC159]|uniref:Helix-turn-helix domain-containing protein n=1 Tax=Nocardia pulmonis TaxID=2951408 RepID=A0A9X2EEW4_9NOCA|nr:MULTISPECIES: helix-turn-helix domain-containing protein [Nocardia]MCM6779060.1 helix-turn-helix domain-containing protein [Nocardia pulmonis]MCM6791950.1 helix-turn-helix domain-containing protein [Nocardia sp. CDC159]
MSNVLPEPSTEELEMVQILAALADPARLTLAKYLYSASQPVECGVAGKSVDLRPATLSHHYRILREAGLTRTFVEGRCRLLELRRADLDQRFPGLLDAVLAN